MCSSLEIIRNNKPITQKVAQTLSNKRFKHTIQVAILAGELAFVHHYNYHKAVQAALLHDYAREIKDDALLFLAEKSGWTINLVERNQPMLLHGPVAAYLVNQELGIEDGEILEAITYHTTGHPKMSPLASILYVADMVEPGRIYPGVEELRKLAFHDLNSALLACLDHNIRYLLKRGVLIHPLSIQTRNNLILNKNKKGEV